MAQSIVLKRSALPGKVPDTGSLNLGEVALNTYDGKVYLKKSASIETIESIVTTNSITTGSIILLGTGSFGELVVTQDANFQRDIFVTRDIVGNGDLDIAGDITGSNLLITGNLVARQLIISSSVTNMTTQFASGSTAFGNTIDDTHTFTGSLNITGSITTIGTITANTFNGSFVGNGAGLTNISVEASNQIVNIDGNNLPIRSIAELFSQLAASNYVDMDFND